MTVKIELEVTEGTAKRWSAQTQYIVSERMLGGIEAILTDKQKESLRMLQVEFQPVVFPQLVRS